MIETFIIMRVSKSCCFNEDQYTIITKQQRTKRLEQTQYFERSSRSSSIKGFGVTETTVCKILFCGMHIVQSLFNLLYRRHFQFIGDCTLRDAKG